jgi:hypothetical protein
MLSSSMQATTASNRDGTASKVESGLTALLQGSPLTDDMKEITTHVATPNFSTTQPKTTNYLDHSTLQNPQQHQKQHEETTDVSQ